MQILNQTQNTILAEKVIIADTPFKRIKGLLGKKDFKPGEALIIKPCNSIHTLFMRFPIDVLFVDKNNRVIKAISSLKPFCLTYIYLAASFAIELPSGTILASHTQLGDHLSII